MIRPSFEQKYDQSYEDLGWQRRKRCRCKHSGQEFSVKKTFLGRDWRAALSAPELSTREAEVLQKTAHCNLPRVPSLVASLPSSNGLQLCVVTEFITGVMLPSLTAGVMTSMPQCDLEACTKRLAVQLLETVGALHLKSKYAHLNITSSSIFVDQSARPWDSVRLADFDYAQRGFKPTVHNVVQWSRCLVIPDGVSTKWGAPELVEAVRSERKGLLSEIDGPAADMWSVGVVLFYLRTGYHPFGQTLPDRFQHIYPGKGDARGPGDRDLLLLNKEHTAWAESVINGTGSPQLQMVRQCSATPDLAADFFARVLHPDPRKRLGASALFHPYLKAVTTQMTTDLGREVIAPVPVEVLPKGHTDALPLAPGVRVQATESTLDSAVRPARSSFGVLANSCCKRLVKSIGSCVLQLSSKVSAASKHLSVMAAQLPVISPAQHSSTGSVVIEVAVDATGRQNLAAVDASASSATAESTSDGDTAQSSAAGPFSTAETAADTSDTEPSLERTVAAEVPVVDLAVAAPSVANAPSGANALVSKPSLPELSTVEPSIAKPPSAHSSFPTSRHQYEVSPAAVSASLAKSMQLAAKAASAADVNLVHTLPTAPYWQRPTSAGCLDNKPQSVLASKEMETLLMKRPLSLLQAACQDNMLSGRGCFGYLPTGQQQPLQPIKRPSPFLPACVLPALRRN